MLASLTVFAQNAAPVGQVYGGYQYTRLDTGAEQDALNLFTLEQGIPAINVGRHQSLNGWSFGAQENLNSWFGGIVDVSGSYYTKKVLVATSGGNTAKLRYRLHSYTFMAGPQFTMRHSSTFQPFVRGLIGGGFLNTSANALVNNVPVSAESKADDKNWAFGGGGGTDIVFSRMLAVRVAVDYIRTQ